MFPMLLSLLRSFRLYFQSRADIQIEILALRQQIVVLQRQAPKPKLKSADRRFWVGVSQFWCRWRSALRIVKPATVTCPGIQSLAKSFPIRVATGSFLLRLPARRLSHCRLPDQRYRLESARSRSA